MKQYILLSLLLITITLSAQNPDSLFDVAYKHFENNQYHSAKIKYEDAINAYQEQGNVMGVGRSYHMMASCFEKNGWNPEPNYLKAEKIFDSLNANDTYHAVCKSKLGKLHESNAMLGKLEQGRTVLCWQGVNHRKLHNYDSAIWCFTQAAKLDASRFHHWEYIGLGKTYTAMGDYKNAIKYFREAIDYVPEDKVMSLFEIYTQMGDMYLKQGKPSKAVDAFIKIPIISQSNFAVVNRNREGLKEAEIQARIQRTEMLIGIIATVLLIMSLIVWSHWKKIINLRMRLSYIEQYSSMLSTMLGFANSNIQHQNLDEVAKDLESAQKMAKHVKDHAS